jgi:hypothetical protein
MPLTLNGLQKLDVDTAWDNFCEGIDIMSVTPKEDSSKDTTIAPKCTDIYISTKTKIAYLNSPINLSEIFWKIPVMPYHTQQEGVVKKQMKFNSMSQEELDIITSKVTNYDYVDEFIIAQIINPEGRIKFKDVRKVSIGLCKKDITSYRCKKKSAFYNCFVVILRLLNNNAYKEIHVKVFNTGKLEIPGIQTDGILSKVLELLTKTLSPFVHSEHPLSYSQKSETVLINSNFNCGYFIDREKLYDILKYGYKINSAFDPCSYPGIQCEFYYDMKLAKQTGRHPSSDHDGEGIVKVSFMIFRTGSVLIVGKCTDEILNEIYVFIRTMLKNEYKNVGGECVPEKNMVTEKKKRKIRKKIIIIQ